MKFQTKIIGIPERAPGDLGNEPTISQFPNQNINKIRFWLTSELGESFKEADAAEFIIWIKGSYKMNNETWYDAEVKCNNKYLSIESFAAVFVDAPTQIALITTEDIFDNGAFIVANSEGTYFLTNGVTNNQALANKYYFTWRNVIVSKELIRMYLRARYYLDNKTELLTSRDYSDDIQYLAVNLGNAIIAQAYGGNRPENIYFEQADYTMHSGATYGMFKNSVMPINENKNNDFVYNGDGEYYDGDPDIYQSRYSTGILYQGGVNIDNNVTLDDRREDTRKVPKKDDGTPEYQRAVMNENSDDIVNKYYKNTIYDGIIKNAKYTLDKIGIQPVIWNKIDELLTNIDNPQNINPAPIVVDEKKVGLNFANPGIKEIFKTGVQSYSFSADGTFDNARGLLIYAKLLKTEDLNEHFCPCSDHDPDKIESFSSFHGTPFFIFLIFLTIVFFIILFKEFMMKEKNTENVAVPLMTQSAV